MQDTHLRSIIKAVSWRLWGTLITMLVTFFFTHKINLVIYVGIVEVTSKIFLFYTHERIWNFISFGQQLKKLSKAPRQLE